MNLVEHRKEDISKILSETEMKVWELLNLHDIKFFDYKRECSYRIYGVVIKNTSIFNLMWTTSSQQLLNYSYGNEFSHLFFLKTKQYIMLKYFEIFCEKQLIIMSKYWGTIIDKCATIMSTNGPLLCELMIANNIKSFDYDTLKNLLLICKSQFINHVVKTEKYQYKKYKKGLKVDCRNNCGNSILIELPCVYSELPLCCSCKAPTKRCVKCLNYPICCWAATPNKRCVECTNYPIIIECHCRRFFHKDPDYKGKWQRCEKCRRY